MKSLILKYLQETRLREHTIAEKLIVPLLEKMGCEKVRFLGGPREYGVDIIFSYFSKPDGIEKKTGIQIKKEDIKRSKGDKGSIIKLEYEAIDALKTPFPDEDSHKDFLLSRLIICTFGKISLDAKDYIKTNLAKKNLSKDIDFWDGNKLAGYLADYCPNQSKKILGIKDSDLEKVDENFLRNLYKEFFNKQPIENEMQEIIYFSKKNEITSSLIEDIIKNNEIKKKIRKSLNKHGIKRELRPIEIIEYGYQYYSLPTEVQAAEAIEALLKQSPEYLRKRGIRFKFNAYPSNINIIFSEQGQRMGHWFAYHPKHNKGALKFIKSKKMVELSPQNKSTPFKLQFDPWDFPLSKKNVRLRYETKNNFNFFIYMKGQNNKNYFVNYYTNRDKEPKKFYGDVEYANCLLPVSSINGKTRDLVRNIEKDLKRECKVTLKSVILCCFSVIGPFKIEYVEFF